ncbi:hypothetical protein AKJ61_03060 [candidate division MSBL1 archaeon SCGC-AAA259B11]|uniref:Uncharacterized protein n=1 Tax=candidate division MSBL1 archaeon SCGC-AAA259B11 TaxID=1698260 RepID=A0A133U5A3_9EURY|nr:hypothetical protein AKJ61_03060 [candidate division MSBL1 archaeon SCGC-AAA259B11]
MKLWGKSKREKVPSEEKIRGQLLKISVREGWREKTQSKASYIFGDKVLQIGLGRLDIYSKDSAGENEGTIILDADFINNASFEEVDLHGNK